MNVCHNDEFSLQDTSTIQNITQNFGKNAFCDKIKGDLMSKMLHENVFDMQLFKKSEFGWVEKSSTSS